MKPYKSLLRQHGYLDVEKMKVVEQKRTQSKNTGICQKVHKNINKKKKCF